MKKPVIVLLHVVYWLLYLLLLALFYGLMMMNPHGFPGRFAQYTVLMLQFAVLPAVIAFYLFYTVLFRYFLVARKILLLIPAALLVSILSAVVGELSMLTTLSHVLRWSLESAISINIVMSFNALLNGLLGLGMKSFITWYNDLKWKEALRKRNHDTEMALIRAQINPHFLFNTINNIDVLIEKDPVKASGYLNRLSDIMRFMLYETRADRIPLEKELLYIDKYIDLQKIRTSNPDHIHYNVAGITDGQMIAPMLFIPFIENAFKHAVPRRQENAISISIVIQSGRLVFGCSNNYAAGSGVNDEYGGLGNELIAKRLELLYPEKHELAITHQHDIYTVKLTLSLS